MLEELEPNRAIRLNQQFKNLIKALLDNGRHFSSDVLPYCEEKLESHFKAYGLEDTEGYKKLMAMVADRNDYYVDKDIYSVDSYSHLNNPLDEHLRSDVDPDDVSSSSKWYMGLGESETYYPSKKHASVKKKASVNLTDSQTKIFDQTIDFYNEIKELDLPRDAVYKIHYEIKCIISYLMRNDFHNALQSLRKIFKFMKDNSFDMPEGFNKLMMAVHKECDAEQADVEKKKIANTNVKKKASENDNEQILHEVLRDLAKIKSEAYDLAGLTNKEDNDDFINDVEKLENEMTLEMSRKDLINGLKEIINDSMIFDNYSQHPVRQLLLRTLQIAKNFKKDVMDHDLKSDLDVDVDVDLLGKSDQSLISAALDEIKDSEPILKMFEEADAPLSVLPLITIIFCQLDVSARTDKGIIYLNEKLKSTPEDIPHYLVHEITHFLQQCFSNKATKGSNDDNYLDNEYEVEGFQNQSDYIAQTEGEGAAEDYIDKVVEHHDVPKGKKQKKKDELLNQASNFDLQTFGILYQYGLSSFAGIKEKLEEAGVDQKAISFINLLDGKEKGLAFNYAMKNPSCSLDDVVGIVETERNKSSFKETTKNEIADTLPADLPYKEWFILQIKKYPNVKNVLLNNAKNIIDFVDERGLEIVNFSAPELLEKLEEKALPSSMALFFSKVDEKEKEVILSVNNTDLQRWARGHFYHLRNEWIRKIHNFMKEKNKSFDQILSDNYQVYMAIERGEMRGMDLPATPLMMHEEDALIQNLKEIEDYLAGTGAALGNTSVLEVVNETKKWHRDAAQQGKGLQYGPLNQVWTNGEFMIVQLTTENDLKVEGSKLDHCVGSGGYIEKFENGRCKIFSLRKVTAPLEPLITIETDPSGNVVRQDYGYKNAKATKEQKALVDEWIGTNTEEIDFSKLSRSDKINLVNKGKYLEELSTDPNANVRCRVAENKSTPAETLKILSKDPDADVRCRVAENKSTPAETLKELGSDSDVAVRRYIARNESTPVETLDQLSNDYDERVRWAVGHNSSTPAETLKKLSKDPNGSIREFAIWEINNRQKSANNNFIKLKKSSAKKMTLSPKKLLEIIKKRDETMSLTDMFICENTKQVK